MCLLNFVKYKKPIYYLQQQQESSSFLIYRAFAVVNNFVNNRVNNIAKMAYHRQSLVNLGICMPLTYTKTTDYHIHYALLSRASNLQDFAE